VGARYLSTRDVSVRDLAELTGNIDLVYEGIGVAELSFQVLEVLGLNGVFVFTGIPAPKAPVGLNADQLMRNLVLKNQVVLGTVNADRDAFQNAIRDLEIFMQRWPDPLRAIITGRHKPEAFRSLLLGKATGIKNIIAFD
jgi:threonine dehydrogenase-like Zn-dependent dehydrogenase